MELKIIFRGTNVHVEMDDELEKFLEYGFVDRAVRNGMEQAAEAVKVEINENFNSGGRPGWEAKTDGSPATLQQTGRLRFAATDGAEVSISDDEVEVATDPSVEYAGTVNYKRPFMVVPEGQPMENVAEAFLNGVVETIKE